MKTEDFLDDRVIIPDEIKNKSWDNIEEILFDGNADEIKNLHCPDCNKGIEYTYSPKSYSLEIRCKHCGIRTRAICGKRTIPNCAKAV